MTNKTCATCIHCHTSISSQNHGAKTCNRIKRQDKVHGLVMVSHTAEYERCWLWRKIGLNTCGPEGRNWKPIPPRPTPLPCVD